MQLCLRMQLDILPSIEPGLYPSASTHQQEIEQYFGGSLLTDLSPLEEEYLTNLDIFFVVFTNRCGSTFLTEMMHQVGFGIPPKAEVFNSDLLIPCCREFDLLSFTHYFMQLVRGWSKNNRVGFKIGAQQLFWLTKTGLLSHCKSIRLINSKRQDRVSQAISLYIARQTGQWHSEMERKHNVEPISYCRNEILQCLYSINHGQQLISYYADIHNLPRISVNYEDTLSDPEREIRRLANFLDTPELARVSTDLEAINIRQQRNEDNIRLLKLFQQDFYPDEHMTGKSDK